MGNELVNIYFLRRGDLVKIGYAKDVSKRVATMQHSLHDVMWIIEGVPRSREKEIHYAMRKWWEFGEWFRAEPESLALMKSIVDGHEPEDFIIYADRSKSTRRMRSKIAAHESWANTTDRAARTAPARQALEQKFLDMADGDPQRAESLRKAHFQRLALKSAEARRRKRAT